MVDFFRWTFLSESHLSIILNITYRIKVSARHSESTYSEVTSLSYTLRYVKRSNTQFQLISPQRNSKIF
jgi:hypothetical protein